MEPLHEIEGKVDLIKQKRFLNQLFPKLKAQNIDLNSVNTDFRWYHLFPFGVPASDKSQAWTTCLRTRFGVWAWLGKAPAPVYLDEADTSLLPGLPPGLCLQAWFSVPFKRSKQ